MHACVFFEGIFQQSCLGNTYVPKSSGELKCKLTLEKIRLLQEFAHQAVSEVYENGFAK